MRVENHTLFNQIIQIKTNFSDGHLLFQFKVHKFNPKIFLKSFDCQDQEERKTGKEKHSSPGRAGPAEDFVCGIYMRHRNERIDFTGIFFLLACLL